MRTLIQSRLAAATCADLAATLQHLQARPSYRTLAHALLSEKFDYTELPEGGRQRRRKASPLPFARYPFIARWGQTIVATVVLVHLPEGAQLSGWCLCDLYVRPYARRAGVARKLVERAIAEAVNRGARALQVIVHRDNERACRLFAALGFVPAQTNRMSRALAAEARRGLPSRVVLILQTAAQL
jgi:ribosomal protein S18 acetylase RimI-like enzyme